MIPTVELMLIGDVPGVALLVIGNEAACSVHTQSRSTQSQPRGRRRRPRHAARPSGLT